MDGLHVEGMTEDERDRFIGAEVGEPVPGEHAFDRDDDIRPIRSNDCEKGLRGRLHVTVEQRLTGLVEDADVHRTGMQVNAAVKWVLRVVQSHWGLLLFRYRVLPTLSIPRWSAGEGASISIKRLHLTPGSGVRWLGTTSVAPAQVKRGVRCSWSASLIAKLVSSRKARA